MPKLSPFLVIAAVVFPFATRSLWAQGPTLALSPAPYEARFTELENQEILALQAMTNVRIEREKRSSHWKEGLVFGGVLGGVFGGGGLYAFCQGFGTRENDCELKALMGGAMAALVGGGLGALIGGLFPKQPPEDQEDYSAPNASM